MDILFCFNAILFMPFKNIFFYFKAKVKIYIHQSQEQICCDFIMLCFCYVSFLQYSGKSTYMTVEILGLLTFSAVYATQTEILTC